MAGELKKTTLNRDTDKAAEKAKEMPEPRDPGPGKRDGAEEDKRERFQADLDDTEPAGEQNADAPDPAQPKSDGRSLARKVLRYGVPALCLAVIASGVYFKFEAVGKLFGNPWKPSEKLEPVISITRPIPIPDYREMLDFLVLNVAEGQKTITAFRMELAFSSPSRYHQFKEHNVAFRDTIYSFLLAQNSSRNTSHSWQAVVEKDLFDYVRVKLPESRPDTMRLTQVENL